MCPIPIYGIFFFFFFSRKIVYHGQNSLENLSASGQGGSKYYLLLPLADKELSTLQGKAMLLFLTFNLLLCLLNTALCLMQFKVHRTNLFYPKH